MLVPKVVVLVTCFLCAESFRDYGESENRPWRYQQNGLTIRRTRNATTSSWYQDDPLSEDYEDDGINWQCGADDLSKIMSEASVEQTCPHLKVAINNCCLSHDDCYDKQLGQKNCDDTFCTCLDKVTKNNESCNKAEAVIFCDLVRQYGAGPYAASATTTTKKPEGNVTKSNQTEEVTQTTPPTTVSTLPPSTALPIPPRSTTRRINRPPQPHDSDQKNWPFPYPYPS